MSFKTKEIMFLLPRGTYNDATKYYVDLIAEALELQNFRISKTENLLDIKNADYVFVVSAKWFFLSYLINKRAKIITWYQGLGSEEALMLRNSKRDRLIWKYLENLSIRKSFINIYVSESMKLFFNTRHKYYDKNFVIIPCFNKNLNMEKISNFKPSERPKFVYAGSLDKWQCIDKTLQLYKYIENKIPTAHVTLLTKNKEEALEYLVKYKINNYEIKYVNLQDLDNELCKFNYGFLIRDKHIVNQVATPTKMNSYLANGVVPIYTDVIDDFNKFLNYDTFIKLKVDNNITEWGDSVIQYNESINLYPERFKNQLIEVFSTYYAKEKYIKAIQDIICKFQSGK